MYSNIIEAWNKDPVKEMTNKLSKNRKFLSLSSTDSEKPIKKSIDSLSLSDIGSLSILSEKRNDLPEKSILKSSKNSSENSICSNTISHLKSCDTCNHRIKQMIDDKVKKKFDELILDNKLKELQNSKFSNEKSISWKEILIIVGGIIIILLIIFLIIKVSQKS